MRTTRCMWALGVVLYLVFPAHAELLAGVGAADITSPIGGMMGGYSDRGIAVSTGVHDALMAKALVLKDHDTALAIVTMDLVGVPSESVGAMKVGIRERTGIEQVMLLASHTHSGPDGNRNFPAGDKPWVEELEEKVVNAVAAANDSLQPVRYGVGKGEVREGHNRRKILSDGTCEMLWRNPERVPTEPVDYELGVIRFQKADGAPLVTLVNFTCHPVILGPENLEISADWPGVMQRTVEAELGAVCMFAQGAAGDINPFMDKTAPKDGAFEEVEKMGKAVAREVVRVSENIEMREGSDVALTAETEAIPIPLRWDVKNPEVIAAFEKKYGKILVKLFMSRLGDRLDKPLMGDLVTVTVGDDLAFVGLPGEFFVQLGLDLKGRSTIPNTFAFGYCNETSGYFPTINAAWQGGYGGKEATVVEVGAGEKFINKALINLYYQTARLNKVPKF